MPSFRKSVKYIWYIILISYYRSKRIFFTLNFFSIGKLTLLKADITSIIQFTGYVNINRFVTIVCVENSRVIIGSNVFIGDYTSIRASRSSEIVIGNDTMIAENVKLISINHEYINKDVLIKNQDVNFDKMNIIIGSDCWIGSGAIILAGVNIGNGAVIGANSVVTRDVVENSVVAGVPARIIKYRN